METVTISLDRYEEFKKMENELSKLKESLNDKNKEFYNFLAIFRNGDGRHKLFDFLNDTSINIVVQDDKNRPLFDYGPKHATHKIELTHYE